MPKNNVYDCEMYQNLIGLAKVLSPHLWQKSKPCKSPLQKD